MEIACLFIEIIILNVIINCFLTRDSREKNNFSFFPGKSVKFLDLKIFIYPPKLYNFSINTTETYTHDFRLVENPLFER